jgi:hypothetical protein
MNDPHHPGFAAPTNPDEQPGGSQESRASSGNFLDHSFEDRKHPQAATDEDEALLQRAKERLLEVLGGNFLPVQKAQELLRVLCKPLMYSFLDDDGLADWGLAHTMECMLAAGLAGSLALERLPVAPVDNNELHRLLAARDANGRLWARLAVIFKASEFHLAIKFVYMLQLGTNFHRQPFNLCASRLEAFLGKTRAMPPEQAGKVAAALLATLHNQVHLSGFVVDFNPQAFLCAAGLSEGEGGCAFVTFCIDVPLAFVHALACELVFLLDASLGRELAAQSGAASYRVVSFELDQGFVDLVNDYGKRI